MMPFQRAALIQTLSVVAFLSCAGIVVTRLQLEENLHLSMLFAATAVTWGVWRLLPERRKPLWFLSASILFLFIVAGWEVGAWSLGIGLLLFGTMHLPISVKWRMVAAATLGFAILLSPHFAPAAALHAAIPIVGGLFMLRSMLYLYELQHEADSSANWIERLTYFFLLPNVALPIFPIVDWRIFRSQHSNEPSNELVLRGVRWIANAMLHFIAYRLIYHYLVPTPSEMTHPRGVWVYFASNYLLIVRLAGIFHLSAGILCLFGWDLPRTFEHYFFARNFNDLWQRVNRYWRDFVMRIFYYPLYFQLRRQGKIQAMVLTLAIVFVANWFLHGWQYWWLRGAFLFKVQDAIFWGGFGAAVIVNSVVTVKLRPRTPRPFQHAVQIAGIFWFMAILWSIWVSPSLGDWAQVSAPILKHGYLAVASGLAFFAGSVLIAWIFIMVERMQFQELNQRAPVAVFVLMLFLLGGPQIFASKIWSESLNAADKELQFRGYYEEIVPSSTLALESKVESLDIVHNQLLVDQKLPTRRFKPNLNVRAKNAAFVTDSLGIIGTGFASEPTEDELRVVMIGGSMEAGIGVAPEFRSHLIAERWLNERLAAEGIDLHVQILNFAVTASHLIRRLHQLKRAEKLANPHMIVCPYYNRDSWKTIKHFSGKNSDFWLMGKEGVFSSDLMREIVDDVHPYRRANLLKVLRCAYDSLAIYKHQTLLFEAPIWAEEFEGIGMSDLRRELDARDFDRVDCAKRYANYPKPEALRLGEKDNHLSQLGHKLVGLDLAEGIWSSEMFQNTVQEQLRKRTQEERSGS